MTMGRDGTRRGGEREYRSRIFDDTKINSIPSRNNNISLSMEKGSRMEMIAGIVT